MRAARQPLFGLGRGNISILTDFGNYFSRSTQGNVYTDGNYAYYERFSPEVLTVTKKNTQRIDKEASVGEDLVSSVSEEGDTFFKNRTDAKDRCCPDNKCLIFWERMSVPIALEHYQKLDNKRLTFTDEYALRLRRV